MKEDKKPKLVVNIEICKYRDISKRKVLHFGRQILKEFCIVRGVRRAINSAEVFSGRVTVKSKPDGRKFRRFKGVGTSKLCHCIHRCNSQL